MAQMTRREALEILTQATEQLQATRRVHEFVVEALKTLREEENAPAAQSEKMPTDGLRPPASGQQ